MTIIPEKDNLCLQLIERTPDAVLFSDREGIIRQWNSGAEAIFGWSADQALGKSLELIIPEKLRDRHWEGYYHVMDTGETHYGSELLAVPALHREFSIVMITDEKKQICGVASFMGMSRIAGNRKNRSWNRSLFWRWPSNSSDQCHKHRK